jgi:hypothetical protein
MGHEISGGYERSREQRIDISGEEWTERLAAAPVYKKTAVVHIRPAVAGERIVTTLAGGKEETENTAGEEDVVVTNPSGEKQIVSLEKAVQRYDLTDTPGLFLAKGMVRAVDNPHGRPISIMAPWGSPQYGDTQCKVAALYDPAAPDVVGADRYLIGKDEFIETYGDQPVDAKTGAASEPVPSPLVLAAMEAYDAEAEDPASGARSLGAIGLYFTRLMPDVGLTS